MDSLPDHEHAIGADYNTAVTGWIEAVGPVAAKLAAIDEQIVAEMAIESVVATQMVVVGTTSDEVQVALMAYHLHIGLPQRNVELGLKAVVVCTVVAWILLPLALLFAHNQELVAPLTL